MNSAELSVNFTYCSCSFPLIYVPGSLACLATLNVPEGAPVSQTQHIGCWDHHVSPHIIFLHSFCSPLPSNSTSQFPCHSSSFLSLLLFESRAPCFHFPSPGSVLLSYVSCGEPEAAVHVCCPPEACLLVL